MSSIFPFWSSLGTSLEMGSILCARTPQLPIISVSKILPYTMDGPFKQSMNFFMRLAWSSKVQLPVLIAVCFMAFDIRLQLEINIFWEANHRQNAELNQQRRALNDARREPSPVLVEVASDLDDEDFESSDFGSDSEVDDDDDDDISGGELVSEIVIMG